ncbi:unnamed protein product [Schistocephalus solidus]|uniref:DUF5727 domain-containing protein n=1 Tax=Schistocephalus solidus TaxID=70667 RepID=A0A183T1W5_SCHSO|nr:unnamed protein product [Schistocephalus solidus]
MGHSFVLVGERPELAWAAYGFAVVPTVGLFERGRREVRESDIPGVEAHTTPETLTWFSPPVVTVARVWPLGRTQLRVATGESWYQLEVAAGKFTSCTRQMERPNAICVVLPLTSIPTLP